MVAVCDETGWVIDPTIGQVQDHGVPVPHTALAFNPPPLTNGCWGFPVGVDGDPGRVSLYYFPYEGDDESWRPIYEGLGAPYDGLGRRLVSTGAATAVSRRSLGTPTTHPA